MFNSNDDLLELLAQASVANDITAVFHVAAVCDYKVEHVEDDQGKSCDSPKNQPSQPVLGVEPVAAQTDEIPTARKLIERLPLTGRLVPLDRLHAQHQTVHQILYEKGADDSLILRDNQPTRRHIARSAAGIPGAGGPDDCAHRTGLGWGAADRAVGSADRRPQSLDADLAGDVACAGATGRGPVAGARTRALGD